jgi:hypothetical protein
MRPHISVVGRHHETAGGPPIVAIDHSAGKEHCGCGTDQQAFQRPWRLSDLDRDLVDVVDIAPRL